jgi:preprotein translocase subunit SecA
VFATSGEKYEAIVEEVHELHATRRPVLIGTRSIDKSEIISKLLDGLGLEHEVLNANEVEREAEIVSHAGEESKITVATNMAGRGTDVKLGEGVAELGGLHVICTELHDAARIDRQLVGRCGRQGDPGTFRQYLALDDEILKSGLGPDAAERVTEKVSSGQKLDGYSKLLRQAQRKVEKNHFRDRMMLLHHEKERKKVQREMGQDPYLDTPD